MNDQMMQEAVTSAVESMKYRGFLARPGFERLGLVSHGVETSVTEILKNLWIAAYVVGRQDGKSAVSSGGGL